MRKIALTAALIAIQVIGAPLSAAEQAPEVPPIEIPLCEEICETYSREPVVVVQTSKPQSEFEFCIVEGLSRISSPPYRYPYKDQTVLVAFQPTYAGVHAVIRIIPSGDGYTVAGYTKLKKIDDRLARYIKACTQD
jgi:hypothetical protein